MTEPAEIRVPDIGDFDSVEVIELLVAVGDTVTKGQTVLIIEAMKTMNQIPAPHDGTVRVILVGDGDPVEFGMPLMVIE
jgi:acetyl-CoA carboxylase biotin carboxyl carrier protein